MTRAVGTLNHDHSFIWDQGIAQSVWTIIHPLNRRPSVTIVDSGGTVVEGKKQFINDNTIIVTFNATFSGKAYLN